MAPKSLRSRRPPQYVAVYGPAAVVLILGLVLAAALRREHAHAVDLRRTYEAIDAYERIVADLGDAQLGQRGYLLTGSPSFLQPYAAARQRIERDLHHLRNTVTDPRETPTTDRIQLLTDSLLDHLGRTIKLRDETGLAPAVESVRSGRSTMLMDELRQIVKSRSDRERLGLLRWQRARKDDERSGALLVLLGSVLAAGLALSTSRILRRKSDEQASIADELGKANEQLELHALELERRTAALTRSEARFRALIQQADEMIFIMDPAGVVRYSSPAVERVLGYGENELVGTNALDGMHPEDRPQIAAAIARLAEPGATANEEFRFRHADGRWRHISATARNALDDPAVQGVVVNSRDVTDHRQIEEQLRQAQKLDAVGRLAGGVAHDFNNILTVIRGHATFLAEGLGPDSAHRQEVEEIGRSLDRATSLVGQLLAFSRQQVQRPEALDVNLIVHEAQKMFERLLPEDTEVVTALTPDLWNVRGDRTQLEQILLNLVVNARDAMPNGGVVTIVTQNVQTDRNYSDAHPDVAPGDHVLLTVRDTGFGMTREVRERAFEPFFTTKPAGKGTGLGLSTVYGIVKQSGGFIWIYSEPGQGTVFKIYLPRFTGEAASKRIEAPAAKVGGSGKILLVEDDGSVRALACRALSRAGYTVVEAGDGAEAIKLFEANPDLDLLLTDVVMPQISGRELAARLLEREPRLRVIFTSGYAETEITKRGSLPAGVQFIEKPYTPNELVAEVSAVLSENGHPRGGVSPT